MSETASSHRVLGTKLDGVRAKFFDDTVAWRMFDMRRSGAGRLTTGQAADCSANEIEVQGAFPFVGWVEYHLPVPPF